MFYGQYTATRPFCQVVCATENSDMQTGSGRSRSRLETYRSDRAKRGIRRRRAAERLDAAAG